MNVSEPLVNNSDIEARDTILASKLYTSIYSLVNNLLICSFASSLAAHPVNFLNQSFRRCVKAQQYVQRVSTI